MGEETTAEDLDEYDEYQDPDVISVMDRVASGETAEEAPPMDQQLQAEYSSALRTIAARYERMGPTPGAVAYGKKLADWQARIEATPTAEVIAECRAWLVATHADWQALELKPRGSQPPFDQTVGVGVAERVATAHSVG